MGNSAVTKRELADRLGVTKQTISNRIMKLGLSGHVRRVGKADLLDAYAVSAISDDIARTVGLPAGKGDGAPAGDGPVIEALRERIEDLKEENKGLSSQVESLRADVAAERSRADAANARAAELAARVADIAERQQAIAALPWWRRGKAAVRLLGPGGDGKESKK